VYVRRLFLIVFVLFITLPARSATVLVLRFHNESQFSDLNWVGESIAETLMDEFGAANQIVLDRESRAEGLRRLSLRSNAGFTKATLIRLGQTLDADYLCYGTYDAHLLNGSSQLKDSSIQLSAHFIDLRKMRDGPDYSEAGPLSELSRLEEHLAWQSLKYLSPKTPFQLNQFMAAPKLVREDAEESYIRGLLSSTKEQQQKWFAQALALDSHFTSAAFELAKLALDRKEYRQATALFAHISPEDPRYPEARFKMGLSAYGIEDFAAAATYFREVAKTFPLSEVYNNLGAAENHLNLPAAIDDFRRALDADENDSTYLFNLATALLKNNYFEEAAKRFQAVLDRDPEDSEARALLERALHRQAVAPDAKTLSPERLKKNFDETAFRQLKAMLQPKS